MREFATPFEAGKECYDRGDYAQAEGFLTEALAFAPTDPEVLWRLASCKAFAARLEDAHKIASLALSVDPGCHQACATLANVSVVWGDFEAGEAFADRCLQIAPNMPSVMWLKSHCELYRGDFKSGFRKWRYGRAAKTRPARAEGPEWRGEKTGTLFVWCEQGFGDAVQFSRWVPFLKKFADRVVFEAYAPLVNLFQEQDWGVHVTAQPPDFHCPYEYDAQVALLDVPGALGVASPADVSGRPYLKAPKSVDATEALKGRKVGIVWAGRDTHGNDRNRSFKDEDLEPLAHLPLVSLQRGGRPPKAWLDMGPYLNDFSQLAAVVSGLDLLVSADTAAAHLAGAMGVPVVMVPPLNGEWRWGKDGSRSCWYGSMRIVRPVDGFRPALEQIAKELGEAPVPVTTTFGAKPSINGALKARREKAAV